ncbi:hypothetical protein VRU48_09870 [Pedobacter sp. KR3-3]|uniref:Carboxypeptidase regulatory-like domain-containing protein n=1 Tax=Pedobacter albus TaxID=3113905 RepID=A0ABU7I7G2_9SPHI|nr:hypothetical protein [Pedobacter sp. KR3-3]MEE1945415.1 hypothetical protein [Pedobacter sp. KR3-3]
MNSFKKYIALFDSKNWNPWFVVFVLVLLLFLWNAKTVYAQTNAVNITVNIVPPYSPYYSDYSGPNASKVLLIIQNTSASQLKLKLTGQLQGDNGIKISTKSTYVPLQPIILNPRETKQLNGLALKDIFDLNSLNVYGIDKVKLVQTSRLPEGNYTFCIQAVDMNTNQTVSATAPLGCTTISIAYPDAPVLINPLANASVKAVDPQLLVFNWINAGYAPPVTQYILQVAEMPLTGGDPNQILNSTSFPLINKTLTSTSYTLSQLDPPLRVGKRYAWRVQAIDPTGQTLFKNDGRSGALVFTYGSQLITQQIVDDTKLYLINPNEKENIVTVTEKSPLNFGWVLAKAGTLEASALNNDNLKSKSKSAEIAIDTNLYRKLGVKRYFLIVMKTNAAINEAPVLFTAVLREEKGTLLSNFKKSKKEALALGFVDKQKYTLQVQALDAEGKVLKKSEVIPFTFAIAQDPEKRFYVQVKTQLRYRFKDMAGDYAVAKTPVTVKVSATMKSDRAIRSTYVEGSAETDEQGNLKLVVGISEKYKDWNLDASMSIANAYYGSDSLKKIPIPAFKSDTNYVDLGKQFANVFGYGLKLYVQKEFPVFKISGQGKSWLAGGNEQNDFGYDAGGNLVYQVKAKQYEAGINIRLYRKGKQTYIPPGEGSVVKLGLIKKENDVFVAEGKTQLETVGGVTKSFVKFEKLLCNIYEGDEYYALAIDATNVLKTAQAGGTSKYYIADASKATLGDGYTATEKTLKFLPKQKIAYSQFEDTYVILSNKPPQSVISGRISYQWMGNPDKVKRAYANQHFHVEVAYRMKYNNGKTEYIGPNVSKEGEENYFVKDFNGADQSLVLLRDAGVVAGEGITDATGRFTLQIDNLGPKGDVGKGFMSRSKNPLENWQKNKEKQPPKPTVESILGLYNKGMEDPDWGTMIGGIGGMVTLPADGQDAMGKNTGMITQLSGGLNITQSANTFGQYQVGAATKGVKAASLGVGALQKGGPASAEDEQLYEEGAGTLERVFIIVPDNYHLWEAQEPLVVQPFEAKDGGEFTSAVWETQLKVLAKGSNGNVLKGMKVIFFRTKEQKFPNMPLGEGNNLYKTGKLINPQTFNVSNVNMKGNKLSANGIYNQEFEKLWEGETLSDGTCLIPYVLAGTDYYMQVTSDPAKGTETYESYITYIDRIYSDIRNMTVVLNPLTSRVAGRVLEDGQSSQPVMGAAVLLNGQWCSTSDKDGYFEVLASKKNFPLPANKLKVLANGYADYEKSIPPITKTTGQQFSEPVSLKLGALAKGWVGNRDLFDIFSGKPIGVQSYIRRKNGAMVLSGMDGAYAINIKSGSPAERLEIIPLDVAFFRDTIDAHPDLSFLTGKRYYDLVVSRNHRMNFVTATLDGKGGLKTVPDINIQVDDYKKVTNSSGRADFNFQNVSVNNYNVILTGNPNDNWIPQVYNVTNQESRDPVYYYISMKAGNTIKGTVTLDGKPVGNAKVYLEYKANKSGLLSSNATLVETRSGKDGKFTLTGIPIDPSKAYVIATLDTNFTVTGNKQLASSNGANGPVLALTSLKGTLVKSLHGFPLSVEELKPGSNNEFLVTGVIDLTKGSTPFKIHQEDAMVRVRDVRYKIDGDKMVAVNNEVPIEGVSNISLKYLNRYNVLLSKAGGSLNELTIAKNAAGKGEILGTAKIIDNSFNYPGSYLNFTKGEDFYLADKVNETINTKIASMTAVSTDAAYLSSIKSGMPIFYSMVKKDFQISNALGAPIKFKFIDFDATANPLNSYVATDGKIHLNVNLDCNIANSKPNKFTVDLKDVVLDNDKVYPGTGAPIELTLENWKLMVNNWTFDPQKGGIYSATSVIKTNKMDIPIKFFNLRSDMMAIDEIDVKNFALGGGVTKLQNIDDKNAVLIYDTKTGSDMSPHWRLSIAGNTPKPAAQLIGLQGLGNLDVSYVQLLSNDESILSLAPVTNPRMVLGNKMAAFMPSTVTNGPDFFDVNGTLDLKAPRMAPFAMGLSYGKNGLSFTKVDTEFEGKGYVHFVAANRNISITQNQVKIDGDVLEKPNKSFETMPAAFYAESNGYHVDLQTNYMLPLTPDKNQQFQIASGGMKVTDNDWSILSFTGKMVSATEGVRDNKMTFNVYGDVQVDGDKIQTGTDTEFGKFKMVYDFKKQTLQGSLNFPETEFGAYRMAGNLEMMMGSKGFYFLGSGKLNTAIPVVGGGYTVGFLVSSYNDNGTTISENTWNTLQAFQLNKNKCFYESHKTDFKGFYLTAGRSLIDYQKDFDFVLVSGFVEAKAAAELSIWATFGGTTSIGASIGATGRLRAGMSAITGTSMSGGFEAKGAAIMKYENKSFSIAAEAEASFDAHVKQSLLFTSISIDKHVAARLHLGTDGYSLEFSSGTKLPDCPPKN